MVCEDRAQLPYKSIVIILIGLPGCGKSTVGKHLARRLQQPFLDSDQAIELRLGCSIREFFEREGEARFRDIEQEVITQLCAEAPGVLATGGGAVLRSANRDALRAAGMVVYLQSQPEDLMRRLRHDQKRPLLQVADPMARLRELFSQRDPLYRETAHHTVETGRPSVSSLVNAILGQLHITPPRRLN
jgi:shikimate kinase